jgi:transcriptional regulator with XRE-family HTH domain
MAFYEKISDYIKQNGIKQTFIADKCGWTKQKLYNLLHGRNRISYYTVETVYRWRTMRQSAKH